MKLFREIFEEEDIILVESKLGCRLKRDDSWVHFTTSEWNRFIQILDEDAYPGGGTVQNKMKSVPVLRAAAMILAWDRSAKTVADKAALLAAALGVAAIDPSVGARLVNSIRYSIK